MSMIDLSTVTAPQVVEALDFEAIFAQLKDELLARLPGVADVLELESEPLTKLLQVAAYREVLLRQRVNEAARSIMLAYAGGPTSTRSALTLTRCACPVNRTRVSASASSRHTTAWPPLARPTPTASTPWP